MSELDEIVTETEHGGWVDGALTRAQSVSNADLAEMDLTAGFDDVLARVWAYDEAVPRVPAPRRQQSRGRRVVASLVVVGGLLGTGTIAAAAAGVSYRSIGGALTGQFGQPGKTENDTSEIVDLDASDFPTVARRFAQQLGRDGLQFAPGYDAGKNVAATIARLQKLGGETDVTGVKGWIADDAACTWERSWLTANEQLDRPGMVVSVAGLHRIADLKIMARINNAHHLSGLAKDAAKGNAAPIRTDVTLNCPIAIR